MYEGLVSLDAFRVAARLRGKDAAMLTPDLPECVHGGSGNWADAGEGSGDGDCGTFKGDGRGGGDSMFHFSASDADGSGSICSIWNGHAFGDGHTGDGKGSNMGNYMTSLAKPF